MKNSSAFGRHYYEESEEQKSMTGLSTQEANARLEKYGKNKLVEAKKDGLVKRFLKQLADAILRRIQ